MDFWLTHADYLPAEAGQNSADIRNWSSDSPDILPFTVNTQLESELMPMPMENLGAMLDMTTDFDWVCVDIRVSFLTI
jgi:hypothetical protein